MTRFRPFTIFFVGMIVIGTVVAYRLAMPSGPDGAALDAFGKVQGAMVVDILDAAAPGKVVRTSDARAPERNGLIDCTRIKVEKRTVPMAARGVVRTCEVATFRCVFIVEAFALSGPSYTMTKRLGCR